MSQLLITTITDIIHINIHDVCDYHKQPISVDVRAIVSAIIVAMIVVQWRAF